jgi:uncharacterized integral membrane protein
MNYFDGQIFFALIVALVLAWLAGLLVARRYAAKVLEFMQTGTAPIDQASAMASAKSAKAGEVLKTAEAGELARQNHSARWRLRIAILLMSVLLAGMIGAVEQAAYVDRCFQLAAASYAHVG